MPAQISFSDPVGSSFHKAVFADWERRRITDVTATYEDSATDLLKKGLEYVKARGTISDSHRKALKAEEQIKAANPRASSTKISYNSTVPFVTFRESVEASTTLRGKKKVLNEAIFEYLIVNKLIALPGL